MPARLPKTPRPRDQIVEFDAKTDDGKERMIGELARLATQPESRSSRTVSLVVGTNRIVHQLGRKPRGCTVTPTVVDASFAWALTSADERIAVITVAGIEQPNAEVEFH